MMRFGPTLKGATKKTELSPDIESVMEIVIDGLTKEAIDEAMRVGIQAVCDHRVQPTAFKRISAGNYGGKLGPYHFHLQDIMGVQRTEDRRQKTENVGLNVAGGIQSTADDSQKPQAVALTFTLKTQPKQRVDMSPLIPA